MRKILVLFLIMVCMPVYGETVYFDNGSYYVNCEIIKNNNGEIVRITNKNKGLLWQHPAYSVNELLNNEKIEINKAYNDCMKINHKNINTCLSVTISPIQDKYYSNIKNLKYNIANQGNIVKIENDKKIRNFKDNFSSFWCELINKVGYQINHNY